MEPAKTSLRLDRERLNRCFNPRSIAVIGGEESGLVLEQTRKLNYQGELWAVNPNREELAGISCLESLDELPGVPDVVFIGIPADPTIDVVKKLSEMGVGGAVCLASGFKEVGDRGMVRQKQLVASAGDMPILGPNCYGYINTLLGAALFPDQHGLSRTESGVAIISCSGNIGLNFTLQQRGLPISWLITVGNQAVIGIEEAMAAALDNDKIRAIGLHIEGINNLPLFVELVGQARDKSVPVIALKTGKSAVGARITLSHTATLAGESSLYSALFDRIGVGQVDTVEEFLEALKLACIAGPLNSNRIASMSCSGGEASLVADLSVYRDLNFPALEPDHQKKLQSTLNEYVSADNPLDYHTFIWGQEKKLIETFSTMLEGQFDITILVIDYPHSNDCNLESWITTTNAFIASCKRQKCKGAVVTCLSESFTPELHDLLINNGITPLHGIDQALAAIECMCKIGQAWSNWLPPQIHQNSKDTPDFDLVTLNEYDAKTLINENGIPVPGSLVIHSVGECDLAADKLGFPLVLKALSSEISHKSELGGVVIGIEDVKALRGHAEKLFDITPTLLVEQMVVDGVAELLIGVSFDRQFGHYLILGFGGITVELIKDRQILMLPTNRKNIIQALKKLKTWPLLDGFRGKAKGDIESVIDVVLNITSLIERGPQEIVELEVNPLMVLPQGKGSIVVDALIRKRI